MWDGQRGQISSKRPNQEPTDKENNNRSMGGEYKRIFSGYKKNSACLIYIWKQRYTVSNGKVLT